VDFVYLAFHSEYNLPIVTSSSFEKIIPSIDEYMGGHMKRVSWNPYDSKYPDDLEGYFEYVSEVEGEIIEIEKIKIYAIDYIK
jgi:hypothetical protein